MYMRLPGQRTRNLINNRTAMEWTGETAWACRGQIINRTGKRGDRQGKGQVFYRTGFSKDIKYIS